MKYLNWFITLPLMVFAAFFAALNTDIVTISFTPVTPDVDLPLYMLGIGMLLIGFLTGAAMVSLQNIKYKWQSRKLARKLARLEKEIQSQDTVKATAHQDAAAGDDVKSLPSY